MEQELNLRTDIQSFNLIVFSLVILRHACIFPTQPAVV